MTTVQKFFVGRQIGEEMKAAIADHMDKLSATEKAAEEKHNKFRLESKERGSTK